MLLRTLSPVSFFVARLLLPFHGDPPSHTFAGPHQGKRHEDHTLLKDWPRVPWRRAGLSAILKIDIESELYLLPRFDLRNMPSRSYPKSHPTVLSFLVVTSGLPGSSGGFKAMVASA